MNLYEKIMRTGVIILITKEYSLTTAQNEKNNKCTSHKLAVYNINLYVVFRIYDLEV